jgi:hypothetical protein
MRLKQYTIQTNFDYSPLYCIVLFQLYLTTYCEGLIFAFCLLSGYKMEPVMNNPVFGSTSPSDFWGRRWNLLVHGALKRGVFKPVRKYFSKSVAVTCTFLASGLMHEWLLLAVFTVLPHQLDETTGICHDDCFTTVFGGAIVFFLWQALVIMVELAIGHWQIFHVLSKTLPAPVRTFLVICLGIPFTHFFTEPYVRSNFFTSGQMGLPMILRNLD